MDKEKYLEMVDAQLREAREHMEAVHKSFIEAKAKYDSLRSSKESYIFWVMGEKGE
jgi:hypothetical protein